VFRYPFDSTQHPFPRGYFIETITGALWLAPLLPLALAVPTAKMAPREVRLAVGAAVASSLAMLLFLASTGFTTQRYTVDFLPLAVLAASVNSGIWIARARGLAKAAAIAVLAAATGWSVVVNLALGLAGPYEEYLKARPRSYVRVAGMFTFAEAHRLALNPSVSASFTVEPTRRGDRFREPLFSMGHRAYRWRLGLEHDGGRLVLNGRSESSSESRPLPDEGPLRMNVRYAPEHGAVTVDVNGRTALVHRIGTLVCAPSQVRIGWADSDNWLSVTSFTGRVAEPAVSFAMSR
jgi:hypothetical protein